MTRYLKLNAKGSNVERLTQMLLERGYMGQSTDFFSRKVHNAVKDFQARHLDSRGRPLKVDGIVGPLTWWALENPKIPTSQLVDLQAGDVELPSGGSTAGRAALAAALREMKAGAREVGRNNSGPWVEKYLNNIIAPPANWCAGFVSWCYTHADGGIPFRYSLGARNIRSQFKRRGWIFDPADVMPEPGDIIVWWRGRPDSWMGHIGLVHHVDNGIIHTVEGNKGGFPAPVRKFDYVLGRIDKLLGFGRVS